MLIILDILAKEFLKIISESLHLLRAFIKKLANIISQVEFYNFDFEIQN